MTGSLAVESGRSAILVDFGGVVTTSVLAVFREFGSELGDQDLPYCSSISE